MAYCDICGNYDSEHTDGEPSMMRGPNYKPLLDYHYSATIMNKWQPDDTFDDTFDEIVADAEEALASEPEINGVRSLNFR